MRLKDALLLLVAVGCASCGGNNPPDQAPATGTVSGGPAVTAAPSAPKASAAPAANAPAVNAPVAGAQWTIYVHVVRGPTHVGESKRLRDRLMGSAGGLNQWYIVHGNNDSTLYHGYYKSIGDDSPDARRAAADLAAIKGMRDQVSGQRTFEQAMVVNLSSSDPQAPPEWDLLNSGGYYTLEIATYSGGPERKQTAVDSVREARAMGVEAYYYHGDSSSSVCIGAWPREAADQAAPVTNDGADRTVIVSTGPRNPDVEKAMMDAAARRKGIDGVDNPIHVAPKFTPRDPTMIAAMKKFPHRYVDGELYSTRVIDPQTRKPKLVPDASYIVVIPRKQENILRQENVATGREVDPERQADFGRAVFGQPQQQPPAPAPRQGRLKSIGD